MPPPTPEPRGRRQLSLAEAIAFHGHRGPWVILGYRAGRRAVEVLRPEGISDLSCIVKTPVKIPYTCAIDGIQVSTGCTMGKLNIQVEQVNHPEEIEYIFLHRLKGETLRLKLKPQAYKRVMETLKVRMGEAAEWCEQQPLHNLFEESLETPDKTS